MSKSLFWVKRSNEFFTHSVSAETSSQGKPSSSFISSNFLLSSKTNRDCSLKSKTFLFVLPTSKINITGVLAIIKLLQCFLFLFLLLIAYVSFHHDKIVKDLMHPHFLFLLRQQ